MSTASFRQIMLDLDVPAAKTAWASTFPHLPCPESDADVLGMLHVARTAARSMPLKARAYSHRWLIERNLPSQLPDPLKPHAERLYPRHVTAVGIAVRSQYPVVKEAISGAMKVAVLDCYANGDEDPLIVRPQMMAARERERRGLGLDRRMWVQGSV